MRPYASLYTSLHSDLPIVVGLPLSGATTTASDLNVTLLLSAVVQVPISGLGGSGPSRIAHAAVDSASSTTARRFPMLQTLARFMARSVGGRCRLSRENATRGCPCRRGVMGSASRQKERAHEPHRPHRHRYRPQAEAGERDR